MTDGLTFAKRGAGAIEKKERGDFGPRITFFKLDDGETAILRFLTDSQPTEVEGVLRGGWLPVLQHDPLPTKAKPAGVDSWPPFMGAPCRYADIFNGQYPDCYVCDHLIGTPSGKGTVKDAKVKYWSVAAVREEVQNPDGTVSYKDKIRTWTTKDEKTGEETSHSERELVLVNLSNQNFYDKLAGMATIYKTICDRDFYIKRQGGGLDTDYVVAPLDPIVKDGVKFDVRVPEHMAKYLPAALEIGSAAASDAYMEPVISERSSDAFYNKFWVPGAADPAASAPAGSTAAPAPVQTPQTDAPADTGTADVGNLIDRMRSAGTPEAPAAPPAADPAVVAATEPVLVPAASGAVDFD